MIVVPIKSETIDYDNLSTIDKQRYQAALRALLNYMVEAVGAEEVKIPVGTMESDKSLVSN